MLEDLIEEETRRYLTSIDLIAASNAPTRAVRANESWGVAQFRSAEGYPGKRPYAGTGRFDAIESEVIAAACEVFGAEHANVQSHSGTSANLAAYRAFLNPGDTLMSLELVDGGHLSHGHPLNVVSDLYNVVAYGVDKNTHLIDYDLMERQARRARPRLVVAGFSAYPRLVDWKRVRQICDSVGAFLLADLSHTAGLVAANVVESPVPVADVVTSSVEKTLRGVRGGVILCKKAYAAAVDRAVFPGFQSSISLGGLISLGRLLAEAQTHEYRLYQESVVRNAKAMCGRLREDGHRLVSGGTDTHLLLIDLSGSPVTGRIAEQRLESIGILSNRNMIPGDTRRPFDPSGLRLGTPTITARGLTEDECVTVAGIVGEVVSQDDAMFAKAQEDLAARVCDLATRQRPADTLRDLVPA